MVKKYHCPNCGRKFIEEGARKLNFKCPTEGCNHATLILPGIGHQDTGVQHDLTGANATETPEIKALRTKWEQELRIKGGINTQGMEEKADYLITIAQNYGGRIPLVMLCDQQKRMELSLRLFDNAHEYNFIRYVVSKGQDLGVLEYEGDCLVLKYPEKLDRWK
ncbi:MAG: hypothetical protein GXY07_20480 [Candidatus Hydrogenedentes bacterium]|nr:hypothetical protein [Candidatus Hydrogenedentota bacterium]